MSAGTVTIIGATGLVGTYLTDLLKEDSSVNDIRLVTRRPVTDLHPKLEVRVIDFTNKEAFRAAIAGSQVLFCAVGTTQQKVKGDKEAYRKIDFDIPVHAASFCKETGCRQFLLVSSVGANAASSNFYLKLKGEVEESIRAVGIDSFSVFRPSILLGSRSESRPAEKIGQVLTQAFSPLLLGWFSKYKPVHASVVAKAMVQAARQAKDGFHVYHYNDMQALLKN